MNQSVKLYWRYDLMIASSHCIASGFCLAGVNVLLANMTYY